jgi:hypothetical protein
LIVATLEQIEEAVLKLSPDEWAAFRVWFAEFDTAAGDERIERDVAQGRLDRLAEEAREDLRKGRSTDR